MWKESGYPIKSIEKAEQYIKAINVNDEYIEESFREAIGIIENARIIHKEEYLYTKAKAKGWLKEN